MEKQTPSTRRASHNLSCERLRDDEVKPFRRKNAVRRVRQIENDMMVALRETLDDDQLLARLEPMPAEIIEGDMDVTDAWADRETRVA